VPAQAALAEHCLGSHELRTQTVTRERTYEIIKVLQTSFIEFVLAVSTVDRGYVLFQLGEYPESR
jgi:hypothetical protein